MLSADHVRDARRPFGAAQWFVIPVVFALAVLSGRALNSALCIVKDPAADCPYYWPISVFDLRVPHGIELAMASLACALFLIFSFVLEKLRFRLLAIISAACVLIVATNLIYGPDIGLRMPVSGGGLRNHSGVVLAEVEDGDQYFHNVAHIESAGQFLEHFNENQESLTLHARTHPPGAVLLYYALYKLAGDPLRIALCINLLALILGLPALYGLLRDRLDASQSGYFVWLYTLIPAIQIYYVATIDAVIAALLVACAYAVSRRNPFIAVAAAAAGVGAALMLSFVCVFILPVMLGHELLRSRSMARTMAVTTLVAAFFLVMKMAFGYDVVAAFRSASAFENPAGFRAFTEPRDYLLTRLEDVAEILFFLGPYLCVLVAQALFRSNRPVSEGRLWGLLGAATLAAMLLVGAYRTGETARGALYIYPFILLAIADTRGLASSAAQRFGLAGVVFGQALGMQLFGWYLW